MSGVKTVEKSEQSEKKSKLNIWIFVCLIVLIYFLVHICASFFNNTTSLYEVVEGSSKGRFNTQYTALVLREEKVVTASKSGYINFFVSDAAPISVNTESCVIDESGELSERLEEASQNQTVLNENELDQLKSTIHDFDTTYNCDSYYETYSFKYKIQSQLLDLINSNVFDGLTGYSAGSYVVDKSPVSGIMMHSVDGFEDYDLDSLEAAMFRRENYNKTIVKSNDFVDSGSPIYKVVTSEDWNLVIQLDSNDNYDDLDYITIEFTGDGIVCEAPFETFTKAGAKYGVISLSKYMIRYVSERYIQIQIVSDSVSGLKIPKTALGQEAFYIIPAEFLTQGGDSNGYGFLKRTTSGGKTSVEYIECQIVKTTDEYAYVSTDMFESGDVLVQPDTNVQYKITAKENLDGVYLTNGGGYSFVTVDILGEDNGYYIISESSNGICVYDQILEDASAYDKG